MTLPKTYDDMVLRWFFTAALYWSSIFISGVLLVFIGRLSEHGPIISWGVQSLGMIMIFYVSFAMVSRMMMLGDALGWVGVFEKKDKHK